MACQVGITTNPERREKEDQAKRKFRCGEAPGGPDATGPWYVYKFDY
ncbi:MAG: hypothetical protein GDA45_01275 [Chromatiales bacterium]|nr:hypothetical protein [Chromatiales bacterium]